MPGRLLRLFLKKGLRVEVDDKPGALSGKIKSAQEFKVPYMVIIGDKELEKGKVSVRSRDGKPDYANAPVYAKASTDKPSGKLNNEVSIDKLRHSLLEEIAKKK